MLSFIGTAPLAIALRIIPQSPAIEGSIYVKVTANINGAQTPDPVPSNNVQTFEFDKTLSIDTIDAPAVPLLWMLGAGGLFATGLLRRRSAASLRPRS